MSVSSTKKDISDSHTIIKYLEGKVTGLCDIRDHFFEKNGLDKASEKACYVNQLIEKYLEEFDKNEDLALQENRAKFYYLKGRLLNIRPTYCKDAEVLLCKSIKLDPKNIASWNELGECYWKNQDVEKAQTCFEGALNQIRNKISLRNLSMLCRQRVASNKGEQLTNIEKGVEYAKEAVSLDTNDGLSWTVLGNAHLSYFFGIQQNPKILKQSLSAYNQAEKDIVARSTPDLHYNKAIALKYEEEFLPSLRSFDSAISYDPLWELLRTKKQQLVKYISDINELVATTGKMKLKKLHALIDGINDNHLGPYSGGSYTSNKTKASVKLKFSSFDNLQEGINEECVILGKVVCSVLNEDRVPFTFCMIDKTGSCLAVTIFNLADGKGVIIGDSVAIPEPYVTNIKFTYENQEYSFRLIRVETPLVMVVNGKKLGKEMQAGVQMSVFTKSD